MTSSPGFAYRSPNDTKVPLPKDLVFYIKIVNSDNSKSELRKLMIKSSRADSVEASIKGIMNQLIDELNIPSGKFASPQSKPNESSATDRLVHRGPNYTVTYRSNQAVKGDFDDEYINQEEFERWSQDQNKVSTLR
jgi:hypothetical protein